MVLLLGIAPFWLSLGPALNRQLFGDEPVNALGLLMALIGLLAAVRMLREDGRHAPRWWPRTLALGLAAAMCVFQLGHSAGLYSLGSIRTAVLGLPVPPPSQIVPLSPQQVRLTEIASQQRNEAELRGDISASFALIRGQTLVRNLYAAACYRDMAPLELPEPPALLRAEDRRRIEQYEQATVAMAERRCTEEHSLALITRKQEEIARLRDIAALQVRIYQERFGS